MLPLLQIVGAVLVLAAFTALQSGRAVPSSYPYLMTNAAGSALLALLAAVSSQWGFLLLEGTWAVISIAGLARQISARATAASAPRP